MPKLTVGMIGAVLISTATVAQQASPNHARGQAPERAVERHVVTNDQLGLNLLKEAHALNQQLTDQERFDLLTGQIQTAGRYDTQLAGQWARELLELAKQGRVHSPGMVQMLAVNSVAESDPEEAIRLLELVDEDAIAPRENEYPGATIATKVPKNIFLTLVRGDGKKAMPTIRAVANSLGSKGRYPYSGVMAAALETRDNNVIATTTRQILTRFQQRIDSPVIAFDFAEMLNSSESKWPKDQLQAAIEAAVDGLEQYPINDFNKGFETTYTADRKSATAHGPVEIGLLTIAWLIKRNEPELWTKLLKKYPNLATFPSNAFGNGAYRMTLRISRDDSSTPPTPEDMKTDLMLEIRRLLAENTDKGMATINNIADPATKAEALSMASEQLTRSDPQRAAQLAAEADQIVAKLKDTELEFRSACARLKADAVTGNRSAMQDDLDEAFQLADKVMRKARDEKRDVSDLMNSLAEAVQEAIKIDPGLVVAHIELVYLPYEKAQMLTAIASALRPARIYHQNASTKGATK